jgi:uncharacterized membrane protein (DUF4010 family)
MFLRVVIIVAVLNVPLALMLLPSLGAAALASGACSLWFIRSDTQRGKKGKESLSLANPFQLTEVLRFSAILTIVMAVAGIAAHYAGNSGVLGVAALSGLADVDAITLSATKMVGSHPVPFVVLTIMVAVASNTIAKTIYAWAIGGNQIGWRVAVGAAAGILCGLGAYLVAIQSAWTDSLQF